MSTKMKLSVLIAVAALAMAALIAVDLWQAS